MMCFLFICIIFFKSISNTKQLFYLRFYFAVLKKTSSYSHCFEQKRSDKANNKIWVLPINCILSFVMNRTEIVML